MKNPISYSTFFALILLSSEAFAIMVSLTTDKNGIIVNENTTRINVQAEEMIIFKIVVRDGGYSSGGFTISRETEPNVYKMVGKPHFTSDCGCSGSRSKMTDINEEYHYTPTEAGRYMAEAVYGRVVKRIDVLVNARAMETTSTISITITTSTTTKPTLEPTTTRTFTSSTLTEPTTTPTYTQKTVDTTNQATEKENKRSGASQLDIGIAAVVLIVFLIVAFILYKSTRRTE